jgi:hypothetical protein
MTLVISVSFSFSAMGYDDSSMWSGFGFFGVVIILHPPGMRVGD